MTPSVRYSALLLLLAATGLVVWLVSGNTSEGEGMSTPDYTVTAREEVPELGTVGQVLVPTMTRSAPSREERLRAIAEQEGLAVAFFFSTTDAVDAHRRPDRDAAARAALQSGFLGRLTRGEFTPGEEIYP